MMRSIARRLARIEERLDAARQRMAKCGYTFAGAASKRDDTRGWTLSERLQRGRQMAFEAR